MYVTNCSASKAIDPNPLPAAERYLSNRIDYVKQLAKDAGEDFAIISGEYGLVSGNIPYYDHLLNEDEVESLAEVVADQIKEQGIHNITFWAMPEEWSDPARAVRRYSQVLERARQLAPFTYAVKFIEEPIGGRERGRPKTEPGAAPEGPQATTVRPENVGFGGPHSMNKKAEPSAYQLRAQDEKGLWQEVRQSTFLPDLQIKARSLVKQFPDRKVEIVPIADNKTLPF
jgi:hypothetical protein